MFHQVETTLRTMKANHRQRHNNQEEGLDNSNEDNEKRTLIWEVNLCRQTVKNFSKISNAHAIVLSLLVTVTFVGFLQPPRGWDSDDNFHTFRSTSVRVFIVFNSLSLYSAICGLMVYVHSSQASIMTLGSVPIPSVLDDYAMKLVNNLRKALIQVALPRIRRSSMALFVFLIVSLLCCVAAFASAGFAAVGDSIEDKLLVVVPLIGGGSTLAFCVCWSAAAMDRELYLHDKLRSYLWDALGVPMPELDEAVDHSNVGRSFFNVNGWARFSSQ